MATDLTDLSPQTTQNNDQRVRALIEAPKEHLLRTEVASSIVKIILFCSQSKGSATESSDIDVMVFTVDGAHTDKMRYRPYAALRAENATAVLDLAERLVGLARVHVEGIPA
ncbi:MAG: nucleotidyltransferase domain-containing protein [Thermodesulfobacteriota bacterium]